MNKKGFTVVELTVSFSLVSIIVIMLFNLISSLRELYVSGDIKTSLLNKQAIMEKKIYEDLNSRNLRQITACEDNSVSCLKFVYADGSTNLSLDVGANTITYGNYTMKLNKGVKIESADFEYTILGSSTSNDKNNAVFSIDIPIKTTLLDDDFGIHIVKSYNSNSSNPSNLTIYTNVYYLDAKIIANGIDMNLKKTSGGEDWTGVTKTGSGDNSVLSFDLTNTGNNIVFAHIFHQDNGTYFEDYNSFVKSNDPTKKSTLKSLEIFRIKDETRINQITTALKGGITDEKTINKIDNNLGNGYFELIIDYPGFNGSAAFNNYNRWIQVSNFTNDKAELDGYEAFNIGDVAYNGDNDGGASSTHKVWNNYLRYINSNKNFVTGSSDDTIFGIGVKQNSSTNNAYPLYFPEWQYTSGTDYTTASNGVDIWVRADDYLNKYALATVTYTAISS